MRRAHLTCASVVFALMGCASSDHAPFIPQSSAGGKRGTGGTAAQDAGSGGSDIEGAGGDTGGLDGGGAGGKKGGAGGRAAGGNAGASGGSGSGGMPGKTPPWAITAPFDQTAVYFMGALTISSCSQLAVARVSDPNKYTIGFPCAGPPIREIVSAGKMYYEIVQGTELHEFVPDLVDPYPADPFANDRKLDAPCALITGYVVSPSGDLIYHCQSSGWFALGGAHVFEGEDTILAMTDNRLFATIEGVKSVSDGVLHPVPAFAGTPSIRVHDETFHYVVGSALWSVDASGTPTQLGVYPAPPDGVRPVTLMKPLIAPDDSLYQGGTTTADHSIELMYRLTIDGTSEVVYTEADKPAVMMNGGMPFITGP